MFDYVCMMCPDTVIVERKLNKKNKLKKKRYFKGIQIFQGNIDAKGNPGKIKVKREFSFFKKLNKYRIF